MLVAAALTLGGSIRVGLEDNFYLPDGDMARSNGDLIAKARQMTEDVGRRPATVEEARALLGLAAARADAARGADRGCGRVSLPLEGVRVLDLSRLLPGPFCSLLLADFGADVVKVEDTGHGRLRALVGAEVRRRRGQRGGGVLPRAEPQQALDPHRPQERGRARGAAGARARRRRAAGVLPARRARPPRRRLRAPARGEPRARVLRDHRLRPGRPLPRALRPRPELPRACRACSG